MKPEKVRLQNSVTSKGKTRYLTAQIRWNEKHRALRAGQKCYVCGTYIFFDEDKQLEHTGICKSCHEALDVEQEEIKKPQKKFNPDDERDFRREVREVQRLERRKDGS